MAVAGPIIGAAIGGWFNDRYGRRSVILIADLLFFIGAVVMASATGPAPLIVGRVFVELGVGKASMTAPLYISEASPAKIRGALVSINAFLITGGQFLSFLINLAFTKAPGTWRWMLGIAALPALLQFILMFFLPESPHWLYRQGREEEAKATLEKIFPADDLESEIQALKESVENEIQEKVPWIVNSEIYPLRFRGICGGIAATANWISNLIVAQSFLSLTEAIGTSWTFLLFGVISVVALFFVLILVPETKGLPIEEVEKMLEMRTLQFKFWEQKPQTLEKNQSA
ncbi:hypothetical protein FNV43_RR06039 [Rhamnella rubrinervis]|uniref:Major facilitator superfamily (MFS) profile domain-containing protein n=1 Tax=Rhamnella rubrinervis TaxID=2594499 RepID=A0A8K0MLL1_9ROSA|nr:hypothetical protein FNV43_RR06039 [Rhamnella rubrinervis]